MFQFPASFSTLRRSSLSAAPLVLLALSAVVPASAAQITGHLGIAGGSVTVSNGLITFGPSPGGTFIVGSTPPNTLSFTAFPLNSTGTIKNLNSTFQPTGISFSLLNFLQFAVDPLTSFELTDILPGTFTAAECGLAPAANQTCTPILPAGFGLSPFNLANVSTVSSTASFSVKGKVRNGSDVTFFTGTFSNTFNGTAQNPQAFQNILATLSSNGSVASTYSATFDVMAVPEPGSFALVGLTLAGAAALRRRRRA